MSEKQNYDKILLASGIVLGLGVAAYGTLTFLGLNDKYKFTTQVSEKAIEPPPGIKKAAEVGQELSASHELKPIAQETQKYVASSPPISGLRRGEWNPLTSSPVRLSTATSRTNGSWTTDWKMNSFTRTS
nr:Amuc_1099 family pilus-like system protein [Akkermansia muciniphila]